MSDIIVKFKPQGQKALIQAIKQLEKAKAGYVGMTKKANVTVAQMTSKLAAQGISWKKLGVNIKVVSAAARGNRLAMDKLRLAIKKGTKANHGLLSSNRLLDHSFATMRSHLLLFNFAMGLGIRQVINFSKEAAKVQQMETAFNTMSGGATNASVAIDKLKEATDGTVSQFDLFQQANNAMILGVTKNSDEMSEMFDMAQRLGAALGRDTASSIESLVTGIGRQSRLMLDNIGIIVKSEEAYEDYAAKLGKTASSLTDAEKKQAFMNATLEAAREKLQTLPEEVLTTDQKFQALAAAFTDAGVAIGEGFLPVVEPLTSALTAIAEGVTPERVKAFSTVIGVTLVGALILYRKQLEKVILRQTMLGWGALATAAGFLAAEVLVMSGVFDDAEDSLDNFNNTSSQTPLMLQGIQDNLVSIEGAYRAELAVLDERAIIQEQMRLNEIALQSIRDESFESIEKKQEAERKGNALLKQQMSLEEKLIQIEHTKTQAKLKSYSQIANGLAAVIGMNEKNAKAVAAIQAAGAIVDAFAGASSARFNAQKSGLLPPIPGLVYAAELAAGLANARSVAMSANSIGGGSGGGGGGTYGKFEQGGYVGGNRHSQGGTIIEAERGEFVMSRNAVESIGLETLNQMNQSGGGGSINVSVTGNVLTQDFVEGELAESIKEAVRRGSDFGIG
tara:strand:+ start:83 stop:2113 length:2031 start_codon:yes stop_codon:yes gene_type:complete